MKVLQIHNFYQIPGGECAVVEAEKELLQREGHAVLQYTKNSSVINELPSVGKLRMLLHIPWNRKIGTELCSLVDQFRPDVAHVHNIFPLLSPSVYAFLHDEGIPVVQTHHNFRVLCPCGLFFRNGAICEECGPGFSPCYYYRCVKGSRIVSCLYSKAISRGWRKGLFTKTISRHIALNRFFAEKLAGNRIPADRISVCGNFVDDFASQSPNKGNYFLFLGRLSPEKGLPTLLNAARAVKSPIKIAGTGPLEHALKKMVEQNNLINVEFLGFVKGPGKSELIAKSLAMIIPSQCYENFPISAIEAQACGTPVIASSIGGLPEIVAHGQTGYLFEPGDRHALADYMNTLAESPELARDMSRTSLDRVRKQFSPETHHQCLMNVYAEAIDQFHN